MTNAMFSMVYFDQIKQLLDEDDLGRNAFYWNSLPEDEITCHLKIKDDLVLSGVPFFIAVFEVLMQKSVKFEQLNDLEGKKFFKAENREVTFKLPFNVALSGERLALNLLQRSSCVSTFTKKFVDIIGERKISLLDTRKTTPGLRWLEKYAVRIGGGVNHRFGQNDVWMIKDNHKNFWQSLDKAYNFFKMQGDFYRPIVVEIHSLLELEQGLKLGISHFLLDNFTPDEVANAVNMKKEGMTFEVSGGINLGNIAHYLINGVDAISVGSLTYAAPPVDLSLKFSR